VNDATRPADDTVLAPAQVKAGLWADARRQVYAVVMGSRVSDLPTRLATAQVIDHDCLLPGALSPEEEQQASYMVQLDAASPFTDWLLFEAAQGLGDWGMLALSDAPRLALRAHLRSLRQASLPDGRTIELEWMDPAILQILLPRFDRAGLSAFMGPMQSLALPRAAEWESAEYSAGQLQWRRVRVAAPN
jgi:hypothetical protein